MSGSHGLAPSAATALSKRSANLARRVLSDLATREAGVLIVTRACPHALAVANCGGGDVELAADEIEARAQVARGGFRGLVIGSDASWDGGRVLDPSGALIPSLRFVPSSTASLQITDGPGWIRHRQLGDLRVSVDASDGADSGRIDYAALLERQRRLGEWCATRDGRMAAAIHPASLRVRGGRVLVVAGEYIGDLHAQFIESGGSSVHAVSDVDAAIQAIHEDAIDAAFVHGCDLRPANSEGLHLALVLAVSRGVPVVTTCYCQALAGSAPLMALASNLELPMPEGSHVRSVGLALLERKAWHHAEGLPSYHLVPTWERPHGGK